MMTNIQYPYYSCKLWSDSLIFLIIFSTLILATILSSNQPFGIILSLVLIGITGKHFKKIIKNLYRNLKKQPALELNEEYLFDHINNIKIYWHNIIKINTFSPRGNTYICFILKDKNKYSEQLKGLLAKIMFKLPDPDNIAVKTELSLIKGKNEEIYDQIYKIHQIKKGYNF